MYKDIFLNRKAACFDLDGTIVDSHPLWLLAHRKVLSKIGMSTKVSPLDYCRVGVGLEETWAGFLKIYGAEVDYTAKDLAETTNETFLDILPTVELEPREGFWSLLAKIREDMKLKIGLVTNTPKKVAEQVLNKIGLVKSLDAKVFGDEVLHKKPEPDMYSKVAKDLGVVKPDEMVVFEDSVVGTTAAAKAKMDIVLIYNSSDSLKNYPGNIVFIAENFSNLANELESTYKEFWDKLIEDIGEDLKKNT